MYKDVIIKDKGRSSVMRQHPWIFSGAISDNGGAVPGDIVTVRSLSGEFLARGVFDSGTIAVRILSFSDRPIDSDFWRDRLYAALFYRQALGITESSNCYRLIHGAGDGIPGLVLDFYNGVVVFQAHCVGIYARREDITAALADVYGENLLAVYDKSSQSVHTEEKPKDSYLYIASKPVLPHNIVENKLSFFVDWESGQKTGFFLDQRDNRALIASIAKERRVINAFSYTGGFSVYAFWGGAREVISVDSSASACELAERNVKHNYSEAKHSTVCSDVSDFLADQKKDLYDLIILDPPAFAKHIKHRHKALIAYKNLNKKAIRIVKSGGFIATFSCSQAIDLGLFTGAVRAAAIEEKRTVRIVKTLHQPVDHPVNIYQPEGEYLKGLLLYIE
ncbi:class I SAM-dependent rRNA methyltransferase [Spirochaetia bacterium 38H-sp]|uniref:Class I SAM-dependent rRNA methyltransferase n=1 Tax=Rarispira pelagica TaxID=3141764 RepID=A0ABU9U9W3_9SPIR